jgi:hypothetical protein
VLQINVKDKAKESRESSFDEIDMTVGVKGGGGDAMVGRAFVGFRRDISNSASSANRSLKYWRIGETQQRQIDPDADPDWPRCHRQQRERLFDAYPKARCLLWHDQARTRMDLPDWSFWSLR